MVENAQWKLSLSYFRMEEDSLSVALKMLNNPFEVKKSKDYWKKKEYFLASNVMGGQGIVNPIEELEMEAENMNEEELARHRK